MLEEPGMAPTTSEADDSIRSGLLDARSAGFDDFSRDELFFLLLSADLLDFVDFCEDLSDPEVDDTFF